MDMLLKIFADIGINRSVFIMFALIIVTFLFLKYMLFLPLRRVMEQRDKIYDDASGEAASHQTRIEEKTLELEAQLKKARSEAMALREKARADSEARRNELVGEARRASTEELGRVDRELEPMVAEARDTLRTEASNMAATIAERILGGQAAPEGKGA